MKVNRAPVAGEGAFPVPAVVCLAAGQAQVPVILKALELGFAVIAVDRDPEAPGLGLADAQILASTYEAPPIIAQLANLTPRYQLCGVVNRSSGLPVLTSAEVSQAFNLGAPTPIAAEQLTNKSALLAACRRVGIPVPDCQSLAAQDDPDLNQIAFPCVVKPAMSLVGKSGIRLVSDAYQLPSALAYARQVSLNGWVNIEEWVPGSDVSLVAMVAEGRVHPLFWKDELNRFQADGDVHFAGVAVPSVFAGQEEARKILQIARLLARHFALGRTILNLSCRCTPGGDPVITEVHLDLGGDLFYEGLLPHCTTHDLLGDVILFLAGFLESVPEIDLQPAAMIFTEDVMGTHPRPHTIIKARSRAELSGLLEEHQENDLLLV